MQVGEVEVDYVVAQQEVCAVREVVQFIQGPAQVAASGGEGDCLIGIRTDSRKRANAFIPGADFEVQG